MDTERDIRLAIIGCGAVTEQAYLPALNGLAGAHVTALIDPNGQANHLASWLDIAEIHDRIEQCYDLFDAAIIACPVVKRYSYCIKLLAKRKPTLVEPPTALSAAESEAIIGTARESQTLLVEARSDRFLWSYQFARFLLDNNGWGQIKSFDVRRSFSHRLSTSSASPSRPETAASGVLSDPGIHVLDSLLHWLGDFADVEYFDDAEGGVEANALINLRLKNSAVGIVELSLTRRLRNTAIIRCDGGTIEIGLDSNYIRLAPPDPALLAQINPLNNSDQQDLTALKRSQLNEFLVAVRAGHSSISDQQPADLAVQLIEACYRDRQALKFSWAYRHTSARA